MSTPPPVVVPLLKLSPQAKAAILAGATPSSQGPITKDTIGTIIGSVISDGEKAAQLTLKIWQLIGGLVE